MQPEARSANPSEPQPLDLLIVGGGLTGLAAARRASLRTRAVAVVGSSAGSLPYMSGALDLLGVFPTANKHYRTNPWEALAELVERSPEHPYGRVGLGAVRRAWHDFARYLESSPLRYFRRRDENILLITAAGTLKPTNLVPATMKSNVLAWRRKEPTMVLGFRHLVDFAPEHVAAGLVERWPQIRAARVDLTELMSEPRRLNAMVMASAFERRGFRDRFCAAVEPLLGDARFLGLPAVIGWAKATEICDELSLRLGVEVFEIPMLSPSLPGMRLKDLLEHDLRAAGVRLHAGRQVVRFEGRSGALVAAELRGRGGATSLVARRYLLATGRFFGGGLRATRRGLLEPLLGLPLREVGAREGWHMETFLGAPGHPINRVGVVTDDRLRPVDSAGRPVWRNLHAAGGVLADHDWVREKSGAGISVASGYAAADHAGEDPR